MGFLCRSCEEVIVALMCVNALQLLLQIFADFLHQIERSQVQVSGERGNVARHNITWTKDDISTIDHVWLVYFVHNVLLRNFQIDTYEQIV